MRRDVARLTQYDSVFLHRHIQQYDIGINLSPTQTRKKTAQESSYSLHHDGQ
jgi:hypothetical protein